MTNSDNQLYHRFSYHQPILVLTDTKLKPCQSDMDSGKRSEDLMLVRTISKSGVCQHSMDNDYMETNKDLDNGVHFLKFHVNSIIHLTSVLLDPS